jgi:hypothetical protein
MDGYGRPGSGRGRVDAARQGARYADDGACVPWATMAAIERAVADAEDRRAAAQLGRRGRLSGLAARVRHRVQGLLGRA